MNGSLEESVCVIMTGDKGKRKVLFKRCNLTLLPCCLFYPLGGISVFCERLFLGTQEIKPDQLN